MGKKWHLLRLLNITGLSSALNGLFRLNIKYTMENTLVQMTCLEVQLYNTALND